MYNQKFFQGFKINLIVHPRKLFQMLKPHHQHLEFKTKKGTYYLKQRGVHLCTINTYWIIFEVGYFHESFRQTIDQILAINSKFLLTKNWEIQEGIKNE